MSNHQPSDSRRNMFPPQIDNVDRNNIINTMNNPPVNPALTPRPASEDLTQSGHDTNMRSLDAAPLKPDKGKRKADAEDTEEEIQRRKSCRTNSVASDKSLGGLSVHSQGCINSARASLASIAEEMDGAGMGVGRSGFGRTGVMDEDLLKEECDETAMTGCGARAAGEEEGGETGADAEKSERIAEVQERKRRRIARPVGKLTPVTTKSVKGHINIHRRYKDIEPSAQVERDRCIREIENYWPNTDHSDWIPKPLRPMGLLPRPKDWTTDLTRSLSKLARLTQGDMRRAHALIAEETGHGVLGSEDVWEACERCQHDNGYQKGRNERGQTASAADASAFTDSAQDAKDEATRNEEAVNAQVPVDEEMEDVAEKIEQREETVKAGGPTPGGPRGWEEASPPQDRSSQNEPSHHPPVPYGAPHYVHQNPQHPQPQHFYQPAGWFHPNFPGPLNMPSVHPPQPPPHAPQANAHNPYPRSQQALPRVPEARPQQQAGNNPQQQQQQGHYHDGAEPMAYLNGEFYQRYESYDENGVPYSDTIGGYGWLAFPTRGRRL